MPGQSSKSILADISAIAENLQDPTQALDTSKRDLLASTLLHPKLCADLFLSLEPSTLKTARSAGLRLTEILKKADHLAEMLSDPRIKTDSADKECLGEIQAILRKSRPLKRLDVLSSLLGENEELSFELTPAGKQELGKWGMIYGHSHDWLNRAVSGQILHESGSVKISTFLSESIEAPGTLCYLLSLSSAYSPQKKLEILINADPDNIARGQVAEWTGPLEFCLGIFYSDPFLGGRQQQSLMFPKIQEPPDWNTQPQDPKQLNNAMTKKLRTFTNYAQEDMADIVIEQILRRLALQAL